ncbi:MAG TPA: hypothetical protein PLK20_03070 [Paludibacteraceae bacterium]|nr:hypothetical protein [Paludibacteraceae bacterium]
MSKLLAEFISNLAAKAGIKSDDAELLELVQNKALAIDIPDTLVSALEQNIHSLSSAESKIKNKLKAEIYNGLDAEFDRMMDDAGIDDNIKSEFSTKKFDSSIKRAVAISNKISELNAKQHTSGSAKDSQKYIDEINKLKSDLSALATSHKTEMEKVMAENESNLTNIEINSMLSGYNYGLGDIDKDIKLLTAKTMLEKALANDSAKIVRKDGKLMLTAGDGSKFFDKNNIEKDLKSYTEGVISTILKATDPAKPQGNNNNHTIDPKMSGADSKFINALNSEIAAASSNG